MRRASKENSNDKKDVSNAEISSARNCRSQPSKNTTKTHNNTHSYFVIVRIPIRRLYSDRNGFERRRGCISIEFQAWGNGSELKIRDLCFSIGEGSYNADSTLRTRNETNEHERAAYWGCERFDENQVHLRDDHKQISDEIHDNLKELAVFFNTYLNPNAIEHSYGIIYDQLILLNETVC